LSENAPVTPGHFRSATVSPPVPLIPKSYRKEAKMLPLPMFRGEKKRLIYDPATKELRTHDGKLLKRIKCPLQKNWEELDLIALWDLRARFCSSCYRYVYDFTNLPEWLIRIRLYLNPDACVHFAANAENLVFHASSDGLPVSSHCPRLTIQEASSDEERRCATSCIFGLETEEAAKRTGLFLLPDDLQPGETVVLSMTINTYCGVKDDNTDPKLSLLRISSEATWNGEYFEIRVEKAQTGIRGWVERQFFIG
jgi:hypothetical protein